MEHDISAIESDVLDYVISFGQYRGQTLCELSEQDWQCLGGDWIAWAASHYFIYNESFRKARGGIMTPTDALPDRVALAKYLTQHPLRKQYWKGHYLEWAKEPLPKIGRLLLEVHHCPLCNKPMRPLQMAEGGMVTVHYQRQESDGTQVPATYETPHHYSMTLGDGVRMHCPACQHGCVVYQNRGADNAT